MSTPWQQRYAQRTRRMNNSAIRGLLRDMIVRHMARNGIVVVIDNIARTP